MASTKSVIRDGILHAFSGSDMQPVPVNSAGWYTWLDGAVCFHFEGKEGKFSARKENASNRRGGCYWRAYRRRNGQLRRAYLGKSDELTLERLEQAAAVLADDPRPKTVQDEIGTPARSALPALRPELIRRPQLIQHLNQSLKYKLTLVIAPAGFGKTTTLAQWIYSGSLAFIWVSLEARDNAPNQFWHSLRVATNSARRNVHEITLDLDTGGASPVRLFDALSRLPQDVILILEDYHLITQPDIHQSLNFWIAHLPPNVHLVISSRTEPPLSCARFAAEGVLQSIDAAALRLSEAETARFLESAMHLNLSKPEIARWSRLTEGWLAGLQLLALAHRHAGQLQDTPHFVFDYFAAEVFLQQPTDMQSFLLQTAVLDPFNAALAEAVTGLWDCQGRLTFLVRMQLFIVGLQDHDGWYRYHPLFREFLLQRGQDSGIDANGLRHRAANWYLQQGMLAQAIEGFLAAANDASAARILEQHGLALCEQGQLAPLIVWTSQLPEAVMVSQPVLMLLRGFALLVRSDFGKAYQWLNQMRKLLDEKISIDATLGALYDIAYATTILNLGDAEQAYRLSLKTLMHPERVPATFLAQAALNLGDSTLQRTGQDDDEQIIAFKTAIALGKQAGNALVAVVALGSLGSRYLAQGRLREAAALLHEAVDMADQVGQTLSSEGKAHNYLGSVYREWNQLDKAMAHLRQGIDLCRRWSHLEHLLDGYYYLSLTQTAAGEFQAAQVTLSAAETLILAESLTNPINRKLGAQAARQRAAQNWLYLAQGQLAPVSRWAQSEDFDHAPPLAQAVLVRLLLRTQQADQAVARLDQLIRQASSPRDVPLGWLVLRALALHQQGNTAASYADFRQALERAEPEGMIRLFADEGETILPLLRYSVRYAPAYVKQLIAACQPNTDWAVPIDLTVREREVLRLLDAGLSNEAIAAELTIAVSTVKKHILNICQKLDVHSRAAASAQARALNIL